MNVEDDNAVMKHELTDLAVVQETNIATEKIRKRRKLNPRNNFGGTTADGNSEDDENKETQVDFPEDTNEKNSKVDNDIELKITVTDLNCHFTCSICNGYFRDAHTISECLHTFCKVCLYTSLINSIESKCPICSTDLGATPHTKIVVDRQLQSFVDKLATRKITSIM